MKNRKTIGVFFEGLIDKYQLGIIKGIRENAGKNVNLRFFPCGHVQSSEQNMSNILFKIAGKENIDGLIILSNTIFRYFSNKYIKEFCDSYADLPIINVGLIIPGIHSVIVKAESGTSELFDHLINDHNYKNFLYIKGPEEHQEADHRFNLFKNVLKKNSIDFNDNFVIHGDFIKGSESKELERIFKSKDAKNIDVIAAANDNMAISAIESIKEIGYNVPTDFAVVGFDNIIESRYIASPLTTIHQPLESIGRKSISLILKKINGEKIPEIVKLDTKAIIRQSCGCFSRKVRQIYKSDLILINYSNLKLDAKKIYYEIIKSQIFKLLNNVDEIKFIKNEIKKLLEYLLEDLKNTKFSTFIEYLNELIRHFLIKDIDISFWDDLILIIREKIITFLTKDELLRFESIMEQSRVLISEVTYRNEALKRVMIIQHAEKLQRISSELNTEFDFNELLQIIGKGVIELGIPNFFLSIYDNDNECPEWSKLYLAVINGEIKTFGTQGKRFQTKNLLPEAFNDKTKQFSYIIDALYFKNEKIGFITTEYTVDDPLIYTSLRNQISSSLKGASLMRKTKNHTEQLENEVLRRTADLNNANLKLQEDIRKRKLLEKVILDISEIEKRRIGQDLHDDLCQILSGISMRASTLGDRLKKTNDNNADFAYDISSMMNDSVDKTKKIVRGLYPSNLKNSFVTEFNELINTLNNSYSAKIEFECDKKIEISEETALHIYRIAQEALNNSIKHSGADLINVTLNVINDKIVLRVIDNGSGFTEYKTKNKGFGLEIMQYRTDIINGSLTIRKNGESGTVLTCIV